VAVLGFSGEGVPAGTREAVVETITTELVKTRSLTVLERAQVSQVYEEQGFQLGDAVDAQSAVRVGKLLAATAVLIGTVSRVGGRYVINARIVDVEKGEALSASSDVAGDATSLDESCRRVARALVLRLRGISPEEHVVRPYLWPGVGALAAGAAALALGLYFNGDAASSFDSIPGEFDGHDTRVDRLVPFVWGSTGTGRGRAGFGAGRGGEGMVVGGWVGRFARGPG